MYRQRLIPIATARLSICLNMPYCAMPGKRRLSTWANVSFSQLDSRSRSFAAYLQQGLGLQKGDRVALMMPNLLQYPVALFGILRAGMVVVNVNPLYTPREPEHQLRDSGASAIVIVTNFAHTLERVVANTRVKHVVLTSLGDQLSAAKGTLVNFVVKYIKKWCRLIICREQSLFVRRCKVAHRWNMLNRTLLMTIWHSCNIPAVLPAWPKGDAVPSQYAG